jgi:hypothetical protein
MREVRCEIKINMSKKNYELGDLLQRSMTFYPVLEIPIFYLTSSKLCCEDLYSS